MVTFAERWVGLGYLVSVVQETVIPYSSITFVQRLDLFSRAPCLEFPYEASN